MSKAITTLPKASTAGAAWVMVSENPATDPTSARAKAAVSATGDLLYIVPTSDPGVPGALWNNAGTLEVSS